MAQVSPHADKEVNTSNKEISALFTEPPRLCPRINHVTLGSISTDEAIHNGRDKRARHSGKPNAVLARSRFGADHESMQEGHRGEEKGKPVYIFPGFFKYRRNTPARNTRKNPTNAVQPSVTPTLK